MVMADGCPQMAEVHDRMPVILPRSEWERWEHDAPGEAFALCRTCAEPLDAERSSIEGVDVQRCFAEVNVELRNQPFIGSYRPSKL